MISILIARCEMDEGAISDDDLQPRPSGTRRPPKPVKHQWFDQWLIARGEPLKTLVAEIEQIIEHREQRRRARKPDVEINHRRMVEGIVCNLAYAVLKPSPTGRLAVNTRNEAKGKTRYDNRAFGKPYPKMLTLLATEGLLDRKLPDAIRGENSSIAPTMAFSDRVRNSDITFADFGTDPSQEVIRLTRVTRTNADITHRTKKDKKLADYVDEPVAESYRAAVQALNAFLHLSDIAFIDDGLEPRVDPYRRTLTRRFTIFDSQEIGFNQVGRLFGGFWMSKRRNAASTLESTANLSPIWTTPRCSPGLPMPTCR